MASCNPDVEVVAQDAKETVPTSQVQSPAGSPKKGAFSNDYSTVVISKPMLGQNLPVKCIWES